MGVLRTVEQKVKFKVPAWNHCNCINAWTMRPKEEKCRFCVYDKKHGYTCVLYNVPLGQADANLVNKCPSCIRTTAGFTALEVQPSDEHINVDPKAISAAAITKYTKARAQLLSQGYPESLVDDLARKFVLGGDN